MAATWSAPPRQPGVANLSYNPFEIEYAHPDSVPMYPASRHTRLPQNCQLEQPRGGGVHLKIVGFDLRPQSQARSGRSPLF